MPRLTISNFPSKRPLEHGAGFQQLQPHVDARAAEVLLDDGQVALQSLRGIDQGEARLLAAYR